MYKTSAVYNAFVCHEKTLGTKLEVCLGVRRWLFHCIPAGQRGRGLCRSPKHLAAPGFSSSQLQTQPGQQITGNLHTLFYICFASAGLLSKTYTRDDVIVTWSEVAHGVGRVRQTGVKGQMHGLWVGHGCGRLLFLSPPQTRCLWVQVPLCGMNVRLPCLAPDTGASLLSIYSFFLPWPLTCCSRLRITATAWCSTSSLVCGFSLFRCSWHMWPSSLKASLMSRTRRRSRALLAILRSRSRSAFCSGLRSSSSWILRTSAKQVRFSYNDLFFSKYWLFHSIPEVVPCRSNTA